MELLAFILYFTIVLGIGLVIFLKSKENDEKDYFLGGRAMGPFVTAMSAQASDMSGWLLMGFPGSIVAFGFGKVWIGIGLAIGTALNWILVAKRLRCFSKASGDSITLPQYLSNRFASKSQSLKITCAIVFLVSFTVYVASGFKAGQAVFIKVFPALQSRPELAMLIFALVLIAYTFLGGFKAVCWTDFFQGIMMLVALITVPIVIGLTGEFNTNALTEVYESAKGSMAFNTNPFNASISDIVSGLAWGLGYFGMPHIIVRFMSIKKPSMVKTSATVSIIWVVLSLSATTVIAFLGRMILPAEFIATTSENIFIQLVSDIFPPFIAGILLSAIIAAAMSTADSQLLVASSSFTSDIYKPVFRKNASNKEIMTVSRLVVVIVSIVAYFIAASGKFGGIMDMVENAWGLFGAAFGPVVILSLFWKRYTYKGALSGIVAGAAVDIIWLVFLTGSTGIYEILPGFIVGFIVSVVVSLIDKKPSDEVVSIFDTALKMEKEDI